MQENGTRHLMPWNPEHYNVKTKEKPTHSEEMQDKLEPIEEDWWKRHKSYIEHRKEFPYYPDKHKK